MQSPVTRWVSIFNTSARIAALAGGLLAAPAHAIETFSVAYGGTATIPIDCFSQPASCGLITFPWTPAVTLQTVSAADGVYRFDSFPPGNPSNTLTFLSLVSDAAATPLLHNLDLSTLDSGLLGGVSATVQGGRVVGLHGTIVGAFQATWTFSGAALSFDLCCVPQSGPYAGQAAMIPEPDSAALMLGGLAAAWLARRRGVAVSTRGTEAVAPIRRARRS